MNRVPAIRIHTVLDRPAVADRDCVLYWMTAYRRASWNFSLQRAVEWAHELAKPLVIFEALRCDYPWASDRLHQFAIEGMADNLAALARKRVLYYPYVEPVVDAGKGLLAALAARAAVVVSDDYPCSFLPCMYRAAADQISARFELVDSNGILPLRATAKVFARAVDFRRFLQKNLVGHLDDMPEPDPLAGVKIPRLAELPGDIRQRWPVADVRQLARQAGSLSAFPINHAVPAAPLVGGTKAAGRQLHAFLRGKIVHYMQLRNQPAEDVTSGLSPYLRAGHISAHQVFWETTALDGWDPSRISRQATGSSEGWWGASPHVESFLDELITWREVGFNMCHLRTDYDQYDSLPAWARQTLQEHVGDQRSHRYSLAKFESAHTHDRLWNAAQRQLTREGRIHNYLRMLWGKKILEWTATPRAALAILIELNNKYALDGRDPNSYSGIFWCLGRYDRASGPERPVYGKIRYMSSDNTARKVRVQAYVARYGEQSDETGNDE